MPLDAVGTADDQDGVVQNLKGALGFGREIHVTRRIQQKDGFVRQGQDCLLEKMVMPCSCSRSKVSKKASRWSTRPSF